MLPTGWTFFCLRPNLVADPCSKVCHLYAIEEYSYLSKKSFCTESIQKAGERLVFWMQKKEETTGSELWKDIVVFFIVSSASGEEWDVNTQKYTVVTHWVLFVGCIENMHVEANIENECVCVQIAGS